MPVPAELRGIVPTALLGAKGIGEIALVGVAPAIANAVYNATGKRIRRFPITPDKIIG